MAPLPTQPSKRAKRELIPCSSKDWPMIDSAHISPRRRHNLAFFSLHLLSPLHFLPDSACLAYAEPVEHEHEDKDKPERTRVNPTLTLRTQSVGRRITLSRHLRNGGGRPIAQKAWSEELTHGSAFRFDASNLWSPVPDLVASMDHSSPTSSNWPESQTRLSPFFEKLQIPQRLTKTEPESHRSRQTLSQSRSVSLSSDDGIAACNGSFRTIRYPQPKVPTMVPEVPAAAGQFSDAMSSDWRRVLKLRERVQILRLQFQEQRTVVQFKQKAISDADEEYIKLIRTWHVRYKAPIKSYPERIRLEELWRQCQAARDAYGPAEDALNAMDNRLDYEEAKLSKAEAQLYGQLPLPQNNLDAENSIESFDDSTDENSVDSEPEYEPPYDDYLQRLGNRDLLLESYGDLMNEKNGLEEKQKTRRQVGLDLDDEDLEFLAKCENKIERRSKELEEANKDVERLEDICIAKGLIGSSEPQTAPSETYEDHHHLVLNNNSQSGENSAHGKPPQRQIATSNNEACSSSTYVIQDQEFGGSINSWLLDKLRSSSVEITLLASFVFQKVSDMDTKTWQLEVLRLWAKDGAGLETPVYEAQTPATSTEYTPENGRKMVQTRYDTGLFFVELGDISKKASASDVSFSSADGIKTEILLLRA